MKQYGQSSSECCAVAILCPVIWKLSYHPAISMVNQQNSRIASYMKGVFL